MRLLVWFVVLGTGAVAEAQDVPAEDSGERAVVVDADSDSDSDPESDSDSDSGSDPDGGTEGATRRRTRDFYVEGEPAPPDLTWRDGPYRWFLSGAIDLGVLYFRPRFSGGYGKPHETWLGFDLNPIFSGEGIGAYGGLRFAVPFLDLRLGARYYFTFRRSFLIPRESYDHLQIESRAGPSSRYLALEAELSLDVPIGPTSIVSELAVTSVQFVDDGFYVYEETIKVVTDPPYIWRGRLGYTIDFGPDGLIRFGVVAELVHLPGRDAWVFRAGGIARVSLWHDLEIRGTFIPAILSPDELGADGGDSFNVGLRFRWATN